MSKFRATLFLLILMTLVLISTGCLSNKGLSAIEYNNEVVAILNNTSAAIEDSTSQYDQNIPNIVTESSTIDTTLVEASYLAATTEIDAAQNVFTLMSQDEAQQTTVQTEFKNYLKLSQTYLDTYQKMLNYYKNEDFKKDLNNVATYDQDLHTEYNEFIKSNNDLVDLLSKYVK